MRTAVVVAIGLVALGAFISLGPLLSANVSRTNAAYAFLGAWFLFSAVDWYIGAFRAGYGALEELRIHAVIFGIPALVALVIAWRTRAGS